MASPDAGHYNETVGIAHHLYVLKRSMCLTHINDMKSPIGERAIALADGELEVTLRVCASIGTDARILICVNSSNPCLLIMLL